MPNMLLFKELEEDVGKKLKEEEQEEEECGEAAVEERPLPPPPPPDPPPWSRALRVPEGPVVTPVPPVPPTPPTPPTPGGKDSKASKDSKSSWSKLRVRWSETMPEVVLDEVFEMTETLEIMRRSSFTMVFVQNKMNNSTVR